MKKSLFLLFLMSLLCIPSAYQLSITVTVTQDTLSVGTNVTLMTNGVEIASGRTGTDGVVKFNVSNGSYFALLKSSIYPLQVTLIGVKGDTAVTLTKRQLISYASAYGQVTGPADFNGTSVSAFQNGFVQKRVVTDEHGYYVMSFIPDGTYDMVFESSGFDKKTSKEYLPLSEFTEVNAKLSKSEPPPAPVESAPTISAPKQVEQSTIIEVVLAKGSTPLAGETVIADTPSGKVELVTDSQGKVHLNAAQSGLYMFTFGSLTASTIVPPKAAPAPNPVPAPAPEQAAPSPQPSAPEQQADSMGYTSLLAAGALFFILLLVGLIVLVAWVKMVAPALAKQKAHEMRELREEAKHDHPAKSQEHKKHHGKK